MTVPFILSGRQIPKVKMIDSGIYEQIDEGVSANGTVYSDVSYKKYRFTIEIRQLSNELKEFIMREIKKDSFVCSIFDNRNGELADSNGFITGEFCLYPSGNEQLSLLADMGLNKNDMIWKSLKFTAEETRGR